MKAKHKTFLGLYKADDVIPLEIKFLVLVGLCTFFSFEGLVIVKTAAIGVLLFACFIIGRLRFLRLLRVLVISSFILLFFWAVFVQRVAVATFASDIMDTLRSAAYITAIFRLFGLIIPGWLFMSVTSEHELLASLRRYKARPEITLFFVVAFNTIAHFITSFKTISFGYGMRVVKKRNALSRLVSILTTLLFNCIILITRTKKVYYLYEDRIKHTLAAKNAITALSTGERRRILEIDLDNVNYEGSRIPSLDSFYRKLTAGQSVLLTGDVGTGKTTLLNIISGIIPNIINCDFSGTVTLDGLPLRGDDVDYVFQHSENSMFYDTVHRQLCHINEGHRLYWLKAFGIDDLQNKAVSDLSIGQKKMVSLLSCLLSDASVCLLDEPTAHLDDNAVSVLLSLLDSVVKDKVVIVSSHDKSITGKFDILISLDDINPPGAEQNTVDREFAAPQKTGDVITAAKRLTYSYPDGTKALTDVSAEISGGEIIGLLGTNGSGKSTFSMLIAEAAAGKFKSHNLEFYRKCSAAIMLQNTDMQFFTTSVAQEIQFGIKLSDSQNLRACEMLELFGLTGFMDEPPQFLSEGQKKCLLVICMLLSEPDILILDEPFDSLDEEKRRKLRMVLYEYISLTDGKKAIIINDQNDGDFSEILTRRIELPVRSR